jgi:hypothetical protein
MASYPASQQIPWLGEQYAAALAAWERNPTDTVRRLEMSMIAVAMLSLRTREKRWVTDKEMPWPAQDEASAVADQVVCRVSAESVLGAKSQHH